MELKVKRVHLSNTATIGELYIDNMFFCNTLEDVDRGLTSSMSVDEIKSKKVYSETAIPKGRYEVTLLIQSAKYSNSSTYRRINAKLPRLLDVPGYEGILIHIGNTAKDSAGCILVGKWLNRTSETIVESTKTFFSLYDKLYLATVAKDKIYITIE